VKLGEQLFLALKSYGQAFRTLDKYQLWSILILPAIISLFIALLIGFLAWTTSDDILYYIIGRYSFVDYDSVIGNLFEIVTIIAVKGLTLFLYLKLYRYLILIILSPVFVNMANVFYKYVQGEEHKMNIWSYCFCSLRGIKFALRNFVLDILVTLMLLIISIIVLWIFPLIPIIILITESYFFATVLMDYRFEMQEMSMKEGMKESRKVPGIPIGIGLVFNLILLVPLLGVMFGPVLAMMASQESINILNQPDAHADTIH
jgi:CysZ protein